MSRSRSRKGTRCPQSRLLCPLIRIQGCTFETKRADGEACIRNTTAKDQVENLATSCVGERTTWHGRRRERHPVRGSGGLPLLRCDAPRFLLQFSGGKGSGELAPRHPHVLRVRFLHLRLIVHAPEHAAAGTAGNTCLLYHRIISRCLFYACIALPALTLLSLLLVMLFKLYLHVGLAVPPLVAVMVAMVHWYANRRNKGTTKTDDATELKELEKEMEANSKITVALMASSFGGLVGTLAALDKQSGDTGDTLRTTHVAIMFMFSTAVMSVVLMTLSMVALKIKNREHRQFIVGAIRHSNVILLCLLAVAAFSAAFVVLEFYILTAFISLALAALVQFVIQHCADANADADEPVKRREDDSNDVHPDPDPIQETQLGWMADIGEQVTAWSLGGVMVIFGRVIGDSDKKHDRTAANKTCMFLLTSAYAAGLGLMFLMNFRSGGPARGGFNAATNILACSALLMIAAAALAIYGVVVMES